MNEQKSRGTYALEYAEEGWKVFPCYTNRDGKCSCGKEECSRQAKHPIPIHGLNDATTDPEQIRKWWNNDPDANVAYAPPENIIVVDVDINHAKGKFGDRTMADLEAIHGKLPPTLTSLTGGGGRQHFFTTDKLWKNATDVLPGIDIRTAGGYAILPPSMHISGKEYMWDTSKGDNWDVIAPLPDWLCTALTEGYTKKKDTQKPPETIPEGSRNDTLFKIAVGLWAKNLSEAAALAALLEENKAKCKPPLPDDEVRAILQSVTKYERGKATAPLSIIRMSDVEIEPVEWLWKPYIPLGKITILQGDPGLGKTFLATRIAATVSNGGKFLYSDTQATEPCNVLFQTAEDGLGDTIKARLLDAEADCNRVFVVDEATESLTLDGSRLREAVQRVRPRLVVIDPLQAYLGAGNDMHKANEVRPVMARLGALAAEYRCAVILIGHQNKATGGKGIYRGLGSIDIAAAARSVLAVGEAPSDKYRRAIVQVKSSLAPNGQTVMFDLDPQYGFLWAGTSDLTADDVLNYSPSVEREAPARNEAEDFLSTVLADGPVASKTVQAEAKTAGISAKTLRCAKEKLGVISSRGKGDDKEWKWNLPISKNMGK